MVTKRKPAVKKAVKKRATKRPAKTTRKYVTRKSQATKKTPTARLKKRRAANTKKKYFPNPAKRVFQFDVFVRKNAKVLEISPVPLILSANSAPADIVKALKNIGLLNKSAKYLHNVTISYVGKFSDRFASVLQVKVWNISEEPHELMFVLKKRNKKR